MLAPLAKALLGVLRCYGDIMCAHTATSGLFAGTARLDAILAQLSFPKIISAHSDGAVPKELAW